MTDRPANGRHPRRPAVFQMQPDEDPSRRGHPEPENRRRPAALDAERVIVDDIDPFAPVVDEPALLRPEEIAEAERLTPTPARPRRRSFSFVKLAAGAFGILVSLAVGLWTDQLVRDLFVRADWLGWLAIGTVAVFLTALAISVGREVAAILRLDAIQHLRREAETAMTGRNAAPARAVVGRLVALTRDKPETARGRGAIAEMEGEIVDPPHLIAFAEVELLAPLDIRARRLILNASKRVSIVTAVSPRAVVDLAYVLYESSRLIRAMATLYGGRPGTFGMMRLFRDVLAHLAVTSSIAVGDSLVQQVVGHGVASRLSTRLGEGVINGLMTARIGIAAMDLCRPLPFRAVRRPSIGDFVGDLTKPGTSETKTRSSAPS
jgi:putative membrane protein